MELSADQRAARMRQGGYKAAARSRVSNGRDILPDCDQRSTIARRYRDISSAILADMGGFDHCSETRKQLVRRFSAAAVLAEAMESKLANGEQIDVTQHCLLTSTMTRVASRIGIDRIPRDYLEHDDALELYERALANSIDAETDAAEAQTEQPDCST